MKKALITGITGQDGSYLAELLISKNYEVHGIVRRSSVSNTERIDHLIAENAVTLHDGDLSDSSSIIRIVNEVRPDEIYNLAAQSHVQVSFDAAEYTGDFARKYLYFETCYQDYSWKSSALSMFAQNSYPTLNAYGQSLLLKWHRQDPVSQKEIDRNNAVYSFQGNRNPFIDYPNMVEYIWGDSTNYEFSFSGQSTSAPSSSISNDKIEFGYIGTET